MVKVPPEKKKIRLVLLPGLDGSGILFQPLLQALPKEIPTTVLSYPAIDMHIADLALWVATQVPKDEDLVVLAESFSGPVAIEWLKTRPKSVVGAIFCATFASTPRPFFMKLGKVLPLSWMLPWEISKIFRRQFTLGGQATEELKQLSDQALAYYPHKLIAQRLARLREVDCREDLNRIAVPTLYLQASRDWLVPGNCARPFLERIPNCKLIRIQGPHLLLQVCPREAADAIRGMIREISLGMD